MFIYIYIYYCFIYLYLYSYLYIYMKIFTWCRVCTQPKKKKTITSNLHKPWILGMCPFFLSWALVKSWFPGGFSHDLVRSWPAPREPLQLWHCAMAVFGILQGSVGFGCWCVVKVVFNLGRIKSQLGINWKVIDPRKIWVFERQHRKAC